MSNPIYYPLNTAQKIMADFFEAFPSMELLTEIIGISFLDDIDEEN